VDDARDLRERAMYAASQEGHHKVYIVDEAHMLTREAWNALLKILEEPPPGVVFVFATTEPQKIAATAAPVLSRLQRFDFRRIGLAAIRDRLRAVLAAEGLTADEDALTIIARHADGGMRDGLSVLDQCLSFGGDRITADRVREVLGLVSDELYGEALTLVADRNPAAVFPLVDRLMNAGADLAEFAGGLGDVLRAMLMVQLGATPEGLTERMHQTIDAARARLAPEDAVRMLRLLVENEGAVRRSGNPRLAVETLLLRWAMMDRTVDLEKVLAGGEPVVRRSGGQTDRQTDRRSDGSTTRPVPPPAQPSDRPPAQPSDRLSVPFTLAGVQSIWPDVVDLGKQESLFLGQALGACRVSAVEAPTIQVVIPPEQGVLGGALEKGRARLEQYLQGRLGGPVALALQAGPAAPAAERPKRMSPGSLRSERLKDIRSVDPALDAAADELDLEIVDEQPPGVNR
jgi:DNA polymerase-3 subunit gamma/tau